MTRALAAALIVSFLAVAGAGGAGSQTPRVGGTLVLVEGSEPACLNVLISGATGVGKSYVACALGHMACRQGLKVLYRRVPRLFDEMSLAKAEGSYARTLARIAKHELLILDDVGIGQITEAQRHDLLELLDDRYHHASTLVTSQLPIAQWHTWIGDPTLADAILDRLVHNAHKLTLKGPSRRKETAQPEN